MGAQNSYESTGQDNDTQHRTRVKPQERTVKRDNNATIGEDENKTRIQPQQGMSAEKPRAEMSHAEMSHNELDQRIRSGQQGLLESEQLVLKNRFVLEKTLGIGGMGVVYRAKDLRKVEAKDRNPYVAVKILNEDFRKYPDAFIALQREARKSQSIAHPNIVNVHDFDRDGDTVFMTMEYMEGKPLDKLIQENRRTGLPVKLATAIFKGMCAALQHAHAENIIHSDFKPGNVFVTRSGTVKVFDFGIARAVAIVDKHLHRGENTAFNFEGLSQDSRTILHNDKSLFDPDTFGALTPAYASLEMLLGLSPTFQDDVFALAVVTYEMLSGEHPYERLNAEEAQARKLKPKRIRGVKAYQWKALKNALAFRREDRTLSVSQLLHDFTIVKKSRWKTPVALAASVAIASTAYFQFLYERPLTPAEIKAQLQYQIKADLLKENINKLVDDPLFSDYWHTNLLGDIVVAREFMKEADTKWLKNTEFDIVSLYLRKVREMREQGKLTSAQRLMAEARKFRADREMFANEASALELALQQYREQQQKLAEQKELQTRKAREVAAKKAEQAKKARLAAAEKQREIAAEAADPRNAFKLAMDNVKQQLRCKSDVNTRNLGGAVRKLKSIDAKKFQSESPRIVSMLATCITKIGSRDANRGLDLKTFALGLFPQNSVLAKIKIAPMDPCSKNIAGLGLRNRGVCRDRLRVGGYGPRMVIVPAKGALKPFAISQFEITVEQFNEFCSKTGKCSAVRARSYELPVTNVSFDLAKSYAKWLSTVTGYTYRIPKEKEWLYAANASNSPLDENRNCSMNSRGINKGEQLEIATTGQKNRWGLVNYVGNAQEWALSNNRFLVALGGAHTDPLNQCDVSTKRKHSGKPDKITGFRLVRLVK